MIFKPCPELPNVPFDPPENIPVSQLILGDDFGSQPQALSRPLFTCGVSGRSYSVAQVRERVEAVATALSNILSWHPNQGSQWDKVVAIYSHNSIDTMPVAWAIHRLSGIVAPANAAYVSQELDNLLEKSKAKVLFTCTSLLPTALDAADAARIPYHHIFLIDVADDQGQVHPVSHKFKNVEDLARVGRELAPLEVLEWPRGQGASQVAFLCFSSGTSGLPKAVMISHRNIIANVLQLGVFERMQRNSRVTEVALGLLPQSHIYALVVICHACPYRGDQVIILPKYNFHGTLRAIEKYSINTLFLVPPILLDCIRERQQAQKYNLSCATNIMTGAASFSETMITALGEIFPNGILRQGYGLTEAATVVSSSPRFDSFPGSSGLLLPGVECKIVGEDGKDIDGYDQVGEVWVRSLSVALGYLGDEEATYQTFGGNWLRTGDKGEFRRSPSGYTHLFIVGRLKELIKVKGMQVAPAELEANILHHPAVVDAAVIAVDDDRDGEIPKAFIVKGEAAKISNDRLIAEVHGSIRAQKARYKWLKGGIEIVEMIPKNSTGKILRHKLKEVEERSISRKSVAKL